MFEYIFFHRQPLDQFTEHLGREGIPCESKDDDMGLVVAVPDNLPDAVIDGIDAVYDRLLADSEKLMSEEGGGDEKCTAALNITLNDGRNVAIGVSPELLNRILTVISYAELNELLDAIASGIENPDHRPLCQR